MKKTKAFESGIQKPIILVIDDEPVTRKQLHTAITAEVGEKYAVQTHADMEEARQSLDDLFSNVIVAALDLNLAGGVDAGLAALRTLRTLLAEPSTHVIAYSRRSERNEQDRVLEAGADNFVATKNVRDVITQVVLYKELAELHQSSPMIERVLDEIGLGMSIQDEHWRILWANKTTKEATGEEESIGRICYEAYHKFYHFKDPCRVCVAKKALDNKKIERGKVFLPIQDKVSCVEIHAAPLRNQEGKAVAVLEVTRFVGDDWQKQVRTHLRYKEVLQAAYELLGCRAIAVYYQPVDAGAVYRFEVYGKDPDSVCPQTRSIVELDEPCIQVLRNGGHKLSRHLDVNEPTHFLWRPFTTNNDVVCFVDVAYYEGKGLSEDALVQDMAPYWRYLVEEFAEARKDRNDFRSSNYSEAVNGFLAKAAEVDPTADDQDGAIIQAATTCIREQLSPLSMHIRTVDKNENGLKKRDGFGCYYECTDPVRRLERNGHGSTWVANTRKPLWKYEAEVEEIVQGVDQTLDNETVQQLMKIRSYAAIPLMTGRRVLGTLAIQFEDDALQSEAKKKFLETISTALSSTLGFHFFIKVWRSRTDLGKKLDEQIFQTLFGSLSENKEQEQLEAKTKEVRNRIVHLVYELTSSDMVLYYRLNAEEQSFVKDVHEGDCHGAPDSLPLNMSFVMSMFKTDNTVIWDVDQNERAWEKAVADVTAGNQDDKPFWVQIGCGAASLVKVRGREHGLLLVLCRIPGWLDEDDKAFISEQAHRLENAETAAQMRLDDCRESKAQQTLNTILGIMGRTESEETLYRLFLLAVTTGEGLRANRAVLLRRCNDEPDVFRVADAVGSNSLVEAKRRWAEASGLSLEDKIGLCNQSQRQTHEGDLFPEMKDMETRIAPPGNCDGRVQRRRADMPPFFDSTAIQSALYVEERPVEESALAAIVVDNVVEAYVWVDYAFLDPPLPPEYGVQLLAHLSAEMGLTIQALRQQRAYEENMRKMTRDINYAFRTRTSVLESNFWLLKEALGSEHPRLLDRMERNIQFFKRAAMISVRFFQDDLTDAMEPCDMNDAASRIAALFDDARIQVLPHSTPVIVTGNQERLEECLLELLVNARDFAPKEGGKILLRVSTSRDCCRIDVEDNGPGVHPDMREQVFEMFRCFPSNRMGLGLPYARNIARAYGGDLVLEAPESTSCGAHFVVVLPLASQINPTENIGKDEP